MKHKLTAVHCAEWTHQQAFRGTAGHCGEGMECGNCSAAPDERFRLHAQLTLAPGEVLLEKRLWTVGSISNDGKQSTWAFYTHDFGVALLDAMR